jgi:hypothetical protein
LHWVPSLSHQFPLASMQAVSFSFVHVPYPVFSNAAYSFLATFPTLPWLHWPDPVLVRSPTTQLLCGDMSFCSVATLTPFSSAAYLH